MSNQTKTRIVFVDDDPMLLASTRRQLLKKLPDCELAFFDRAVEALESFVENPPNIVLSDVRMPEMDGAEFLTEVSKTCPNSILLAWTGHSEANQLQQVFAVAHQVLSKPCPTESLFILISEVVKLERQFEENALVDLSSLRDQLPDFDELVISQN